MSLHHTFRAFRQAHVIQTGSRLTLTLSRDAGEFILSRHMNDIEIQNEQMVCPNPAVRCNIGAAVITRNWNIQVPLLQSPSPPPLLGESIPIEMVAPN
jgi:hypothetical protein